MDIYGFEWNFFVFNSHLIFQIPWFLKSWQHLRHCQIKMQSAYLHFKSPNILSTSNELSQSNFFLESVTPKTPKIKTLVQSYPVGNMFLDFIFILSIFVLSRLRPCRMHAILVPYSVVVWRKWRKICLLMMTSKRNMDLFVFTTTL